ncbi:MAG: YhcH/YjgK/YiaL family protein [Victivallaceae bacterium]|nr:YhcH/YjgK/YiaL family protein [Victivallaceae bacterium]
MICDTFKNIGLYFKEGDALHTAVTYARDFDFSIPDGEYEVQGRDIFAKVMTCQTFPAPERKFEAHKKYIDVQVILEGKERMDVSIDQELEVTDEYDKDSDFIMFKSDDGYSSLMMKPGKFVIFFPDDIHRPNCNVNGTNTVRKICMKVKV